MYPSIWGNKKNKTRHLYCRKVMESFRYQLQASMAQLDADQTGDHEIFSAVIISLPLIQERQLSVSGERMCTILVDRLEDKAFPVKVW